MRDNILKDILQKTLYTVFNKRKKHNMNQYNKNFDSKYVFRILHFLDYISNIKAPNNISEIINLSFIFLIRFLNPFAFLNKKYIDLFECKYVNVVNEKFKFNDLNLFKDGLKKIQKILKKNKKDNKELRACLVTYIHIFYAYLNLYITLEDYKMLFLFLGYADVSNEKEIFKLINKIEISNMFYDSDLIKFINKQDEYFNKKTFDIAVCATVSSGKSTFINALLGNELLPEANEATTALITTICNSYEKYRTVGYSTLKESVYDVINSDFFNEDKMIKDKIDYWNTNLSNDGRIFVQYKFDGISCKNKTCVIHDTPGTNSSRYPKHHDITMNFLKNNRLDAIIFLLDVSQSLTTTDVEFLLTELYNKVIVETKIPILFVFNKCDKIDKEKEDLENNSNKYKNDLEKIGYKNPKIFYLSSKTAKLARMLLNGKADLFTRKEKSFLNECLKESFLSDNYSDNYKNMEFNSTKKVYFDKKEYNVSEVIKLLNYTGIYEVEKQIEDLF